MFFKMLIVPKEKCSIGRGTYKGFLTTNYVIIKSPIGLQYNARESQTPYATKIYLNSFGYKNQH